MSRIVKFRQEGADTGHNEPDAIQPVENGEDVSASVSNRPLENLRYRSDMLRNYVEATRFLSTKGFGVRIVDEDDENTFLFSDNQVSVPTEDDFRVVFGGQMESHKGRVHFPSASEEDAFSIRSNKKEWEGGNRIEFELTKLTTSGSTVTVDVVGGPCIWDTDGFDLPNKIEVTAEALASLSDIKSAIEAHTVADSLVSVSVPAGNAAHVSTDIETTSITGTSDAATLLISPANLEAFFEGGGSSLSMDDGDILGVWFEDELAFREYASNAESALTSEQFYLESEHPERAAKFAIPLFSRHGNVVHSLTGDRLVEDIEVTLGSGPEVLGRLGTVGFGEGAHLIKHQDVVVVDGNEDTSNLSGSDLTIDEGSTSLYATLERFAELIKGRIGLGGSSSILGSLVPGSTETYSLGESTYRWLTGFFTNLNVSGEILSHLLPTDGVRNLGDPTHRWSEGHFNEGYIDTFPELGLEKLRDIVRVSQFQVTAIDSGQAQIEFELSDLTGGERHNDTSNPTMMRVRVCAEYGGTIDSVLMTGSESVVDVVDTTTVIERIVHKTPGESGPVSLMVSTGSGDEEFLVEITPLRNSNVVSNVMMSPVDPLDHNEVGGIPFSLRVKTGS